MRGERGSHGAAARRLVGRYLLRRLLGGWVPVAVGLEIALAVVDVVAARGALLTSSYVVPVLALALVENGERTALVAVLASALSLFSGLWDHYFLTVSHLYRMAVVVGGCGLSTLGAHLRTRATVARDRMELMIRVGEIADGTAELEDALLRLASLMVPVVSDACELIVFEDGGPRRVTTRLSGADPERERELAARREPPSALALEVAREGEVLMVSEVPWLLRRGAPRVPPEALSVMRQAGMTAALYASVRAGEETLALMILTVGPSGRRFREDDLRFARTVGTRAGLAIKNSLLLAELHEARQRLEAVVGSLADAVTIRELGGRLIYANDAALRFMGLAPDQDVSALEPGGLFDQFRVSDEHGEPLRLEDLPSVRLLAGEEPEPLVLRFVPKAGGEEYWRTLKSTPLYDTRGRLEAAVTVIEDVTASKRAEMRSAFLSRSSDILAGSLDFEETLRNVAWLAVPEVADWCAVDLFDEHGRRQQVVAAHRDPRKVELAHRLRDYEPDELDPDQGLGLLLRTGEPQLYREIPAELVEASARSAAHLGLLRQVQLRSAIAVPMRGTHRILGAMTLVNAESGRLFSEDDVSFAEQIAARAAVAVENARLYSERARIARTLQHSLLPEALPEIPGWEIASMYRPAGGEDRAVEVGGDFYDAFTTERGWVVVIGDVTGKGVEAASMTSLVRHGARFMADHVSEPSEILARIDRALRQQADLSLCTALCLHISGVRVTFASAGHPLPLLVTPGGTGRLGEAGSVLGAFADGRWPTCEIDLAPDDVLLLYTDGVTDTVGGESRFGESRLCRMLAEHGPLPPPEMLARLDTALTAFQVGPQADDRAALALRRRAEPPA